MGSLVETKHAQWERVVAELMKGKETATQLQALIQKPVKDRGLASLDDLALQVVKSFSVALSKLSSCAASTGKAQFTAVDGGDSASRGETKRKAGVKNRRGRYKRRRTSDSWMTTSSVRDDGFGWRKYGQKNILNSEYPRCYFRCTYRHQRGCKATKQVQKIKKDVILYQTTYFNQHTCTSTPRAPPPPIADSCQPDNPLSFQESVPSKQDDKSTNPTSTMCINIAAVKKEDQSKEHAQNENIVSDAKSPLPQDPWQDIIGSESFGYKPVWAPMTCLCQEEGDCYGLGHPCGCTVLCGPDVEIHQLGDTDIFPFGD